MQDHFEIKITTRTLKFLFKKVKDNVMSKNAKFAMEIFYV